MSFKLLLSPAAVHRHHQRVGSRTLAVILMVAIAVFLGRSRYPACSSATRRHASQRPLALSPWGLLPGGSHHASPPPGSGALPSMADANRIGMTFLSFWSRRASFSFYDPPRRTGSRYLNTLSGQPPASLAVCTNCIAPIGADSTLPE